MNEMLNALAAKFDITQTAETITVSKDGEDLYVGQSGIPMADQIEAAYGMLIDEVSDPVSETISETISDVFFSEGEK